ncbi:MAG TPA: hypothetical protein VKB56_10820 [Terriglobales bacterium]|nr:hypothetical protein [Terriglobales bacterium]
MRKTSLGFRLLRLVALIALASSPGVATVAAAQNAATPVHMIVTVEPRSGNQVPVIQREDVLVYQGKDRLPVVGWTAFQGENAGLELYLLIDDSLSPSFGNQINELRSFVAQQPASTAIGVAYMRNGAAEIVHKPTSDHAAAAKSIRLPQAVVGGSPYESLGDLIKNWPAGAARREVLLISDGIEPFGPAESSNPFVQEALTAAQRAGIPVSTIYAPAAGHWGHTWWRINWGLTYLSQVADESGGEAYGTAGINPVSFAPYLSNMSQRLEHQYELSFVPKPQETSGMQAVRITTEVPRVDLVAASRVYVPASE